MKIYLTLLSCILYLGNSSAQEYFIRSYDPYNNGSEQIQDIIHINGDIWMSGIGDCNNLEGRCFKPVVINSNGDILSAKKHFNFSPGFYPIYSDSILYVGGGNNHDSISKYYLYKTNLEGDSLQQIELKVPDTRYIRYFGKGIVEFNNQIIVYGQVTDTEDQWQGTNKVKGLLFWVNKDMTLDTITFIEPPESFLKLQEAMLDPDSNLTMLYEYTVTYPNALRATVHKVLLKLNKAKEQIFHWESPRAYGSDVSHSSLTILNDSLMVIDFGDTEGSQDIIAIGTDGDIEWEFVFDTQQGFVSSGPLDLTLAKNGDILGCGLVRSVYFEYGQSSLLFRLSPEGELLWQRAIVIGRNSHPLLPPGFPIATFLFTVIELPNGDLVAGGEILNYYDDPVLGPRNNQDFWLVKTDSMGCLTADCDYEQILTDVVELPTPTPSDAILYPNPTTGMVWINNAEDFDAFAIFTTNGQRIQSGVLEQSISLEAFEAGMYIIQLQGENGVQSFRVVKQ